MDINDDLVVSAQGGDKAAQDELLARWSPLLRRLTQKYRGALSFEEALSAAMQGFLTAVRLYKRDASQTWAQWLSWKVYYAIKSEQRKEYRYYTMHVSVEGDEDE